MRKVTYVAVLETTNTGYSVFFPDVPGCITIVDSIQNAVDNAKEALELHLYGMEKDHEPLPEASKKMDLKELDHCFVVPVIVYPNLMK